MQPIAFQVTIASTGVAQALPSNPIMTGGVFAAKTGNTASIEIGNGTSDSSTTGYILAAATQTPFIPFQGNTNAFYVVGTSGDILSFLGV